MARQPHAPHTIPEATKFTYKSFQWLQSECPSARDGLTRLKEDSLAWEAGALVELAMHRLSVKQDREQVMTCAMALFKRFYCVRSIKRNDHTVIASASLLTALKLRNMARRVADVARAMLDAALEVLPDVRYGAKNEPKAVSRKVYSSELWIAYAATKAALTCAPTRELSRGPYEDMHARLAAVIPQAEISLLAHVGFQSLPDVGWEWRVLHSFEQRLKMQNCPGWLDPPLHSPSHPSAARPRQSGRQMAVQFLVDSASFSLAPVRFTPNTVAVAAIRSAMQAAGLSWHVERKPGRSEDEGEEGEENGKAEDNCSAAKVDCVDFFVRRMSVNSRMDREAVDIAQVQEACSTVAEGVRAMQRHYSRVRAASGFKTTAGSWLSPATCSEGMPSAQAVTGSFSPAVSRAEALPSPVPGPRAHRLPDVDPNNPSPPTQPPGPVGTTGATGRLGTEVSHSKMSSLARRPVGVPNDIKGIATSASGQSRAPSEELEEGELP